MFLDLNSVAPKMAFIANPPPPFQKNKVVLTAADRLTEYDVLVIDPAALRPPSSGEVPYEVVHAFTRLFSDRRVEFREFLALGGVAAVFLRFPQSLKAQLLDDVVYNYELFAEQWALRRFGFQDDSGTSREVLDPDDPMSLYLRQVERWVSTVEKGPLADDPHGYALAVNRQGRPVAFVEHVGPGCVYWIPPCGTDADWRLLISALERAWNATSDPLIGLAADELKRINDQVDEVQTKAREGLADLRRNQKAVLDKRQRLTDEDADVARALQHYRAARHASPAKALDFLHRMSETIEHVYGGEAKALAELGYSKNTLGDITRPANNKSYRARHEGGENQAVPEGETKKAFAAADEILGRFLDSRLREI